MLWQVDVVFEEVDEIVLQDSELPFIAGRLAEPVQPNLLRMRELLAASKCNVVLVDSVEQVSADVMKHMMPSICTVSQWGVVHVQGLLTCRQLSSCEACFQW